MKAEDMNKRKLRELDAWIGVNVFGKKAISEKGPKPTKGVEEDYFVIEFIHVSCSLPHYTTDKAAAFEVLAKLITHADNILLWKHSKLAPNKFWFAHSTKLGPGLAAGSAPTLELAICLLAKKIYSEKE